MDRPMKHLNAGQKATCVFCALFAGTGFVALALFGAAGILPALVGAAFTAGPLAALSYVVFLRSEERKEEEVEE